MDKSVDYMMHICGYFADDGADVGGEGCGSVVPATREEVAHASAMRGLRQEAGDVEEAPLPEHEVLGMKRLQRSQSMRSMATWSLAKRRLRPGQARVYFL